MAAPFVVACTHCDSKLKLKDSSFVGKKLRCPKCQEVFVVSGAAGAAGKVAAVRKSSKPKDEFDFSNISEDDYEPPPPPEGEEGEEIEEQEALPQSPLMKRKAAAKTGKRKKRKASSGPGLGKIALVAAIILVGIGAAGGIGYGIYLLAQSLGGGGANRFAWLPDDSEVVAEIRVADVWNSKVLEPLVSGPLGAQITRRMQENGNLELSDIDRLMIGSALGARTPVVVIYVRKTINQESASAGMTKSDYGGYALYTRPGTGSAFFPDSQTMVMGPEDKLKAAIDRQGVCPVASKFQSLPTGREIAFLTTKLQPQGAGMPLASGLDPALVNSLAVGVSLSGDIGLEMICECREAADAARLAEDMQKDRDTALAQIETQKGQFGGNPFIDAAKMESMLSGVESALQSYEPVVSGTTVSASLSLPGSLIQDASEMLASLGPMLPAFGGMGGAPVRPAPTIPHPPSSPPPSEAPGSESPASEHGEP
jgi:hypothetical protein